MATPHTPHPKPAHSFHPPQLFFLDKQNSPLGTKATSNQNRAEKKPHDPTRSEADGYGFADGTDASPKQQWVTDRSMIQELANQHRHARNALCSVPAQRVLRHDRSRDLAARGRIAAATAVAVAVICWRVWLRTSARHQCCAGTAHQGWAAALDHLRGVGDGPGPAVGEALVLVAACNEEHGGSVGGSCNDGTGCNATNHALGAG